jgi:hypothetical protein
LEFVEPLDQETAGGSGIGPGHRLSG